MPYTNIPIIPGSSRSAQFGGLLGQSLGTGLQALAQHKMLDVAKRNMIKMGYSPEQVDIATSPIPHIRNLAQNFYPQQQQQQQQPQSLESILQALHGPSLEQIDKSQLGQDKQGVYKPGAMSLLPQEAQKTELANQLFQQQQTPQQTTTAQPLGAKPLTAYQQSKLAESQEKLKMEKEKAEERRSKTAREVIAPYKATHESTLRTDDKLVDILKTTQTGKTLGLITRVTAKKLGLEDFIKNPTQENLEKALAGLGLGVGAAYGKGMGRILLAEYEAFLKSNVNYLNSPQGSSYLAASMLSLNERIHAKYNAANQIIKENKGKIPYDLDDQIDKRTEAADIQARDKMQKLQNLLLTDKLPAWDNEYYNPAAWKKGSEISINKVPFKLNDRGFWEPNYSKL